MKTIGLDELPLRGDVERGDEITVVLTPDQWPPVAERLVSLGWRLPETRYTEGRITLFSLTDSGFEWCNKDCDSCESSHQCSPAMYNRLRLSLDLPLYPRCPKCGSPMAALFTSTYCPKCG